MKWAGSENPSPLGDWWEGLHPEDRSLLGLLGMALLFLVYILVAAP